MDASGFHFVLTRGPWSKVLHEDGFHMLAGLESEGWRVAWDSARSAWEGYSYAAAFERAIPQDWNDSHGPRPIPSPLPLYRSVSPAEMVDIGIRGAVMGMQNRFNEFEDRRFAFFGATLSDNLARQGEDLERQAMTALSGDRVFVDFAALAGRQARSGSEFAARCREMVSAGYACRDIARLETALGNAARGNAWSARQAVSLLVPRNAALEAMAEEMSAMADEEAALRQAFGEASERWVAQRRRAASEMPFTSAVIVTGPMCHGYVYSPRHGLSGMGDEDEYGFFPSSVTADDIVEVRLMKDGRQVRTLPGRDRLAEAAEFFVAADASLAPA